MKKIKDIENKNNPLVIAHRGYRGSYPENTISAFEAAIEVNADMIELDVCLTRDRIPVVIHDMTLERTTDGVGFVSNFTLSELKELDAGSWFKKEFKGEPIPSLEETLEQIRGRITVNIEIKPESYQYLESFDSIEIQICELLEKFEMEESVIISSFKYHFFPRIQRFYQRHKKSNTVRISLLRENFQTNESILRLCKSEKAYSYNPNESFVTENLINLLNESGYRIFPYTVNDFSRMEKLIKYGVNGLITDEPEILRKLINKL
tara:strand:- start:314 stop:1105 length:792 start_codon:yes stop_codon:yes gene_type:complete